MRVRWNDRSKKQLRKTANYIGKKFGETAKRDFLQDNKIVYRIVDDHIEVVALWDTRREPQKQAQQVKDNL